MRNKRIIREWLNAGSGFFYTVEETVYKGKTRYQDIELVRTHEYGTVLLLDGVTQVVQKNDWQYHEPMVHFAMLSHSNPEKVLVIGGGDGGILREVLRYASVRNADLVELDEEVVSFSRKYLPGIHGGAFEDRRVAIHFEDGRKFVERKASQYDVVIMDMTDPQGPSRFLYTKEFFDSVKAAMKDERALFAMHSESPITRPQAFSCIGSTLGSVFPIVRRAYVFIQMYATLWSISVASVGTDIAELSEREVDERIERRRLPRLNMINGPSWKSMLVEYPYLKEILATQGTLITDEHPDFPDHFTQDGR